MSTARPPASASARVALRCPRCATEMVAYERSGIVLDQCRECRGIFLDRGELERLVDAESGGAGWAGPRMRVTDTTPRTPAANSGGPQANARPTINPRGYASEWRGWDDEDRSARSERQGPAAPRGPNPMRHMRGETR